MADKSWRRLDAGLPRKQGWFTVLRQAMCADADVKKLGLYFGTTAGEIWASRNEGQSWTCIARHLPQVFSVTHGMRLDCDAIVNTILIPTRRESAAFVHGWTRRRWKLLAARCAKCLPISTVATPACGFA